MWTNILLKAILFALLLPGVHLSIPPGGTLKEKAIIHGIVFAVVNYLAYKYVRPLLENFDNPSTKVNPKCPDGYRQCASGDCVSATDPHETCPGESDAY